MARALPLDEMTTAEKLQMLELLWTDLSRQPEDVPSPSWHGDVLREREQQDGEFVDWVEAKQRLRDRRK